MSFRTEIRPLCDIHRQAHMEPVAPSVYRCTVHACERRYEPANGYFHVIEGETAHANPLFISCPEDESAMYLEAYDERTNIGIWRCAESGCGQQRPMAA